MKNRLFFTIGLVTLFLISGLTSCKKDATKGHLYVKIVKTSSASCSVRLSLEKTTHESVYSNTQTITNTTTVDLGSFEADNYDLFYEFQCAAVHSSQSVTIEAGKDKTIALTL